MTRCGCLTTTDIEELSEVATDLNLEFSNFVPDIEMKKFCPTININ